MQLRKNYLLFEGTEVVEKYDKVIQEGIRNKVAYKGENGRKFGAIKELAQEAMKLLQ